MTWGEFGVLLCRGIVASAVTLSWVALALGSGQAGWAVVLLAVAVSIAAVRVPQIRAWTPVFADWERGIRRHTAWKAAERGYRLAVDLGLVTVLNKEAEARAFTWRSLRALPRARFKVGPDGDSLWVEAQTRASNDETVLRLARAHAPVLGRSPELVRLSRPTATGVLVEWPATAPLDVLAEPRENLWQALPGGVPVLGRTSDGQELALDLVGDQHHVACQGQTRSGKSVALMGLLGSYAPTSRRGAVIVGGIDPTGLLLAPWANHPGAEFRALGLSDLDAVTAALLAAVSEMDRRIAWLMEQGRDKVTTPDDFAALFFVLEEYPGLVAALGSADALLKPGDRRLPMVKAGVQRLIQEGAKAGVCVLLLAQRMDASIVGGSERSNIGTRISLRVDNRDAVAMLHPDADPETVERIRGFAAGYAYVERPAEAPQVVRFDAVEYSEYRRVVLGGSSDGSAR